MKKGKPVLDDAQLNAVAATFRALSEPTRLRILQTLQAGPHSVSELVAETGTRQANVSKQLGILLAAGLVARRRKGALAIYSIGEPMISELCNLVCSKIQRDAEQIARAFRGHL